MGFVFIRQFYRSGQPQRTDPTLNFGGRAPVLSVSTAHNNVGLFMPPFFTLTLPSSFYLFCSIYNC
jgi:hypothetical protein